MDLDTDDGLPDLQRRVQLGIRLPPPLAFLVSLRLTTAPAPAALHVHPPPDPPHRPLDGAVESEQRACHQASHGREEQVTRAVMRHASKVTGAVRG